ncbi:conserved hypothetical protein [Ricinus communis]|uniref:Uncharacterized protein n=1 Tax=Ricinus communis TaxID=3988 RepID=B9S112_RICCO|nr:conserved hypothetical protein [Ricinus communis]
MEIGECRCLCCVWNLLEPPLARELEGQMGDLKQHKSLRASDKEVELITH